MPYFIVKHQLEKSYKLAYSGGEENSHLWVSSPSIFLVNYLEKTIGILPVLLFISLRILWALSKPKALDIFWSGSPPLSSKLHLDTVSVLLLMWQANVASDSGEADHCTDTIPLCWIKEDSSINHAWLWRSQHNDCGWEESRKHSLWLV